MARNDARGDLTEKVLSVVTVVRNLPDTPLTPAQERQTNYFLGTYKFVDNFGPNTLSMLLLYGALFRLERHPHYDYFKSLYEGLRKRSVRLSP